MIARSRILTRGAGLVALACVLVLLTGPAGAQSGGEPVGSAQPAAIVPATVSIDLCATDGSVTLPGAGAVPIWGYVLGDCSSGDPASLPGPVINAAPGETVNVTLHNDLAEPTSIVFPGSNADPVEAPPGGSAAYSFSAGAGTYLYQSGSNVTRQVAMGLYGALVVDPASAGHAYSTPASAYDSQAVVVLSEVDPDLNADPNGFNLLEWAPTYWLVNGEVYPDADPIPAGADSRVLLRYVNASLDHHTMALLGEHQKVVAKDADPLEYPFDVVAETIPAGSTADMVVSVPAVPAGTLFPLYNRQLRLTNENAFPGGMQTFLQVTAGLAPRTVGVVPRLVRLGATAKGHRVTITARTSNCGRCTATVKMRVRGAWKTLRLKRTGQRYSGVFRAVPSGRWKYVLKVKDASTGIRLTAPTRRVRVR